MINDIVLNEKARISKINIGDDHKLVRDRWLSVKKVLDDIYKKIPPLSKKDIVVDLNPSKFNKIIFESVLRDLLEENITTYKNFSNALVVTSESIRSYFAGENVIVKDVKKFENYRDEISGLYNYIQEDGYNRFYSFYNANGVNGNDIEGLNKDLNFFLKNLSPHEQKILEMRFGLIDGISHTLEEVAQEFNEKREKIKEEVLGALLKIKKYISDSDWLKFKNIIHFTEDHDNETSESINKSLKYFISNSNKIDSASNNTDSAKKKISKRTLSDLGKISRIGSNASPVIRSVELSKEILKILYDMRGMDGAMFGIFGKWGRGKTFLINQIKERIRESDNKEDGFIIVDFNAWKYQDTPASWAYLYEELLEKYIGSVSHFEQDPLAYKNQNRFYRLCFKFYDKNVWFLGELLNRTKRFYRSICLNIRRYGGVNLTITIFLFLLSLFLYYKLVGYYKLIATIPFVVEIIKIYNFFGYEKTINKLLKDFTTKSGFVEILGLQHKIQKEIETLLRVWVGNNKKHILLVVDDIDRCPEERIMEIVDSLKIMLDNQYIQRKVVAVAAIDERILSQVVKNKYKNLFNNTREIVNQTGKELQANTLTVLTKEYLDKLFLCGLALGELTSNEKSAVLENVCKLDIKGINLNKSNFIEKKSLDPQDDNQIKKSAYSDSKNIGDLLDKDKISVSERESIKAAIMDIDITPRQIDILVFRYLLARNLLQVFGAMVYDDDDLGIWIINYMTNESLPDKDEMIKQIIRMAVPY